VAVLFRLLEELGQSLMQTLSELETTLGRIMHPEALGLVQRCRDRLLILTERILTLQRHAEPLKNPWVPKTDWLDLLDFFKELARQQSLEAASIRLFSSPRLQAVGQLDPARFEEAALLLLQEVQRRNPDEEITVTLRKSGLDSAQLLVALSGAADWELPETATLADFLTQQLEESDTFGLELLVAWDVLDRHGIALEFHREQERASGFSFSLPLHPDSATQFT
jgi:K+-sensing histidine kinase KdpD